MAKRHDISAEYARQLLDYNPETGALTWKARTPDMFGRGKGNQSPERQCARWNGMYAGKPAGGLRKGYVRLRLGPFRVHAHVVIWVMIYGSMPANQIDHRSGVRSDNRLENLREAADFEQSQNRKKRVTNKSGLTGVSWDSSSSKWRSEIQVKRQRVYLGKFSSKEDARAAYLTAKAKYHTFQPVPRD